MIHSPLNFYNLSCFHPILFFLFNYLNDYFRCSLKTILMMPSIWATCMVQGHPMFRMVVLLTNSMDMDHRVIHTFPHQPAMEKHHPLPHLLQLQHQADFLQCRTYQWSRALDWRHFTVDIWSHHRTLQNTVISQIQISLKHLIASLLYFFVLSLLSSRLSVLCTTVMMTDMCYKS